MIKYFLVIIFCAVTLFPVNLLSQSDWKADWANTLTVIDSMFYREQLEFRTMQSYQNDATEELILKDIDSLNAFIPDINAHIEMCNKFTFPQADKDAVNASETFKLKLDGLKEYFEQCRLQIHVNNNILQRKLKNEILDFKVRQIDDLKLNDYTPNLK